MIQSVDALRRYCEAGECHTQDQELNAVCSKGWKSIKGWKYRVMEHGAIALALLIFLGRFKKILCYLIVPLPNLPVDWKNDPDFLSRIGAVIPCHMSADEIEVTVRSILRHLPPQNIVVVDNANKPWPPDNTKDMVHKVHPQIQYVYVPIGLKTLAIWTGIQCFPDHVEYIMHVDDDTQLPENMVFDEGHFKDPTVSEVAYGIVARRGNTLQDCVGFIFKMNTQNGVFNNATSGTVLWAPGIIGLVRRHVFTTVLKDHLFLPFGEDCYHGFLQLMNGYKIVREARSYVITYAPPVFSTVCGSSVREQGYGAATLWKQRALRWMVTRLRRGPWMALLMFTYQGGSVWKNVWFRINEFDKLARNVMALLAPLILARTACDIVFSSERVAVVVLICLLMAMNYCVSVLQFFILNYLCWCHRPDYQVELTTVLFMPVVRLFLAVCQMTGHALCLLYWMPFVPTRVWSFTHGQASRQVWV